MEVDSLELRIESEAKKALTNLDSLSEKLDKVSNSLAHVNSSGLSSFAGSVRNLTNAMNGMQNVKVTDFNRLAKNIEKLSNIDSNAITKSSNAIQKMASSLTNLGTVNAVSTNVASITNAIAKLGYKSSSNGIANIPKLATAMNELIKTLSKAPTVSNNVINLANALANLASQGSKVRTATNAMSNSADKASKSVNNYSKTAKNARTSSISLASQLTKIATAFYALKRIVDTVGKSIKSSMDYTETINLFQTSLKKVGLSAAKESGISGKQAGEDFAVGFMKSAQNFTLDFSDKLSLDPEKMLKYQVVFAQITNSIGNTAETADNVSKSFMMLGNDIASLWNIDTANAMEKLQSALTGQVKPMRELGVDITNASLQQTAYNYGINDSISKMSQAAKVQLRYLTIMNQSRVAFFDMAKTINSPANQLRILKQQWDNLCRSIGNVFMPIIQNVLPYINALVIALRKVTDSIAAALGFKVPDYADTQIYADISTGADDAVDSLEGISDSYGDVGGSAKKATSAVEKFKKAVMGFDEFNILTDNTKSSSGGSGGLSSSSSSGGGGYSSLDNAINDESNGYINQYNKQLKEMQNRAEELADGIVPKIQGFIDKMKELAPVFAGIAAAFATYKLAGLFSGLGSVLSTFATPTGICALVVGALVGIGVAIYELHQKALKNDLAKRFGDITLSAEELEKAARTIVDNGSLDKLKVTLSSWDELDRTKEKIEKSVEAINKLNFKVSIGMELTEAEEKEYKQAIDDYVKNCKTYVEQEQLAVAMSINLLIKDEDVRNSVTESSNKFYLAAEGELNKLGKELNDCVTKSWKDGLLDVDEANEIQEIQQSMAKVMEGLATSNFNAKLKKLEMDFDGCDLTPESYKKLENETSKMIEDAAKDFDEVELKLIASLDAQLEAGTINTDEYDNAMQSLKKGRLSQLGEITMNATRFDLNTVYKAFNGELERKLPAFQKSVKDNTNHWFDELGEGGEFEGDWGNFFFQIGGFIEEGFDGISDIPKENLQKILKDMEPKKEELEKQAAQWLALGEEVPKNISDGLKTINYLEAISGNTTALYELIGGIIASSPEKSAMLQSAIDSGVEVPSGIIRGMNNGKVDIDTSVSDLINSLNTDITSQTESIKNDINNNGKEVSKEYADGINSGKGEVGKASEKVAQKTKTSFAQTLGITGGTSTTFSGFAKSLLAGFKTGLDSGKDSVGTKSAAVGTTTKNKFKTELGISGNSSSLFKDYGKYTIEGYKKGISDNKNTCDGTIGGWVSSMLSSFKSKMGINSPSRVFKSFGVNTVEGYNNGIVNSIGDTENTMNKWISIVQSSANGLKVNPIIFESAYRVNTQGLEGYNDLVNGNVSVGGKIENTTTQVIDGLEEKILSAMTQALNSMPSRDLVLMADGNELARTVNKQKILSNQRFQTVTMPT